MSGPTMMIRAVGVNTAAIRMDRGITTARRSDILSVTIGYPRREVHHARHCSSGTTGAIPGAALGGLLGR